MCVCVCVRACAYIYAHACLYVCTYQHTIALMGDNITQDAPQFFAALALQKEFSGSISSQNRLQRSTSIKMATEQLDKIRTASNGDSATLHVLKRVLSEQVEDTDMQQVGMVSLPSPIASQASAVPASLSDYHTRGIKYEDVQSQLEASGVPQKLQANVQCWWQDMASYLRHPHCYLCVVMQDGFAAFFIDNEHSVVRGIVCHRVANFVPRQLDMSCGWGGVCSRPYPGGSLFVNTACGSSKLMVTMEGEREAARAVASFEAEQGVGQRPMLMIIDGGVFSCKTYYLCRDLTVAQESYRTRSWDAIPKFLSTVDVRDRSFPGLSLAPTAPASLSDYHTRGIKYEDVQSQLEASGVPQKLQANVQCWWQDMASYLRHPHCYLCVVMQDGFAAFFIDNEHSVVRGIVCHRVANFVPRQLDMSCGWGGVCSRPYPGGSLFVNTACGSSKLMVTMEGEREAARAVASFEAEQGVGQRPMLMIIDGGVFSCKTYYLCRDLTVAQESFRTVSWDASPKFLSTTDVRDRSFPGLSIPYVDYAKEIMPYLQNMTQLAQESGMGDMASITLARIRELPNAERGLQDEKSRTFPGGSKWGWAFDTEPMSSGSRGTERAKVDDHDAIQLGKGHTLAILAGKLELTEQHLEQLPAQLRVGLFEHARTADEAYPVYIRLSHTHACGLDLARAAVKVNLAPDPAAPEQWTSVMDMLTTESVNFFHVKNMGELQTFNRMSEDMEGSTFATLKQATLRPGHLKRMLSR